MKILTVIAAVLISSTAFCGSGKVLRTEQFESGKIKAVYTEVAKGSVEVVNYWENGIVREKGQYLDGKLSGTWMSYSEEGTKVSEATFEQGKRTGVAYAWSDSGVLIGTVDYTNDGYAELVE
ncbi:hypothetical protein N9R81_01705 [Flavobacteriales bacterium]|nr:hypothetical protein [Flavobacteriales bacterium]